MDSRTGHNPTPTTDASTTIIDEMTKKENGGLEFMPAPGEHLEQGDDAINNALAPMDDVNRAPRLFIAEHCHAIRFMLENYTGQDGRKGACKDPRDCLVFDLTAEENGFVEEERGKWRGGGSF